MAEAKIHPCVDVGVLTIVPTEIEALFATLEIEKDNHVSFGGPQNYWVTNIHSDASDREISIVVSFISGEAGNTEAAIATTTFLRDWHPRLMCLVGIAAGIEGKVRIADVVVPSKVHDRTTKVFSEGSFRARGQTYSRSDLLGRMLKVSPILHETLDDKVSSYRDTEIKKAIIAAKNLRLDAEKFSEFPAVLDGSIVSDNVLIRDGSYFSTIVSEVDEKVRGGEMEAAGFVRACAFESLNLPWLVIRGVSDFGDERKDDSFQSLAAKNACAVLYSLLKSSTNIELLPQTRRSDEYQNETLTEKLLEEGREALADHRWLEVCRLGATFGRSFWLSGHLDARIAMGRMVEEAAAYAGNSALRARALIDDIGWTLVAQDRMREGRKNIEDGIRVARDCSDYYVVSKGSRHLASILRREKNLDGASQKLDDALQAADKISDAFEKSQMRASLCFSGAKIDIENGEFGSALNKLQTAWSEFGKIGDKDRAAKLYSWLGRVYQALGEGEKAKEKFIEGRDEARNLGRVDEFELNTELLIATLSDAEALKAISYITDVVSLARSKGLDELAMDWEKKHKDILKIGVDNVV